MTQSNILITVPACLEILLLSKPMEKWRKRLKCIIFDEVHEIGDTNGAVWEHLLALIPCQFIALSATIGYPKKFVKWMRSFAPGLSDVSHVHRVTDLNFFVAKTTQTESSLISLHPLQCIQRVSVTLESDVENVPPMNPKQAKELFELLQDNFKDDTARGMVMKLEPLSYFKKDKEIEPLTIERSEFTEYEAKLRKLVAQLAELGESQAKQIQLILEKLRSPLTKEYNDGNIRFGDLATTFPLLLKCLQQENKLPVIAFSLRKSMCETLLEKVLKSNILLPKPAHSDVNWGSLNDVGNKLLITGLKMGIGIHHAALKKSYRLEVERLFRSGLIKVVIATGTLAMVTYNTRFVDHFVGNSYALQNSRIRRRLCSVEYIHL
jgi:superfamily II RNA helicase